MDSRQKQQDTINVLLTIGTCCTTVNRKRLRAGNNYTPLYWYSQLTTHYLRVRSYVKQCDCEHTVKHSFSLTVNADLLNCQQNINKSN